MAANPDAVDAKKKLEAAQEALTKYLEFLPGAHDVLRLMVADVLWKGTNPGSYPLSGIFAVVDEEDVEKVRVALDAIYEARKKALAKPTD